MDRGQVEQVIVNLAVNARDAMPRGGQLTIETSEAELDESYARTHSDARVGRFVCMAISDTGSGIPPETKGRIFEPFFTTKGPGRGTGLGLAVVHGIIKQSGGNIDVYSEVGSGTAFRIYLPAVQEKSPGRPASEANPSIPQGSETILLVEDDDGVRSFASLILKNSGYTVLEASGGIPALELMANSPGAVDLLVTDVVMPEIGGRKLAETLQSRYPALKVLFLSGYTDDAVVRHGILEASVTFLQKPFTPGSLTRKVREALGVAP
jgi:CheY-like chemotaxis protein